MKFSIGSAQLHHQTDRTAPISCLCVSAPACIATRNAFCLATCTGLREALRAGLCVRFSAPLCVRFSNLNLKVLRESHLRTSPPNSGGSPFPVPISWSGDSAIRALYRLRLHPAPFFIYQLS